MQGGKELHKIKIKNSQRKIAGREENVPPDLKTTFYTPYYFQFALSSLSKDKFHFLKIQPYTR